MEKITPSGKKLGLDEIHIHLLRIISPLTENVPAPLLFFLPREDEWRFRSLELESTRLEFLWSRLLVRKLLAFYADREMEGLTFGAQKWGKPFLENSKLQFNLSHSQNLVAFSVGHRPLGLDVEKLDFSPRARRRGQILAERFFSPGERDYWRSSSGMDQTLAFFRIFTMKEAYMKALGRGLGLSLGDGMVPFTIRELGQRGNWEWLTPRLGTGEFYMSHVAWNPTNKPHHYVIYEWNEEILLNDFRNSGFPPPFLFNAAA